MGKFTTEVHLSREMSLLDATMIGVGAMIGAGIFVLTGIAAGVAGPALVVAFLLNGAIALLTAMSYAELGSCYHDAGGGYLWVKEALPKWNGFISGWMSWFAHAVACSLYALGFGAYFGEVLKEFGVILPSTAFFSPQKILAVGVALVFAYINFRGASETGKVGNFVTITKIVILAIFIGFGLELILRLGNWNTTLAPFMPYGWAGIVKAMGLTFIAFQGFEVISQASEEVKDPKRNIPRAVFLSLLIVVPIYVLIAITSLGSVQVSGTTPWEYLAAYKETALVEVAKTFFVGGGVMLLVGGLISTMSALNATVYSSSRVAFAMGRDRNFPTFFSRVHPKRFTPHLSIVFSLIIVVVMTISLHIEDVASAADIMFLLLFLQVNLALIRLRAKRPDLDRGFFVPLFPYLTIAGIVLLVILALYMFTYSPLGWFVTIGWISAGLVLYRFYASKREVEYAHKVAALGRLERRDYTILVAVSKPSSAQSLLSVAMALAQKHDGEIVLLHVIEVAEHLPLRAGLQQIERGQQLLESLEDVVNGSDVPIRSVVKISHKISDGIVETARQQDANFIILGRDQHPSFVGRFFSSLIDSVLQKTHAEVAVLHGEFDPREIRRITIPFGANIHTKLAMEITPGLMEYFRCPASIVVVLNPGLSDEERRQRTRQIESVANEQGLSALIATSYDRDVVRGIVNHSAETDLIVMSGRSTDFIGLLLGQSLTQEITERAACPVLWVKEYEERPSFWSSLFKPYTREVETDHV